MSNSEVTSGSPPPDRPESAPRERRARRRIPAFLVFGIVAATIEMGIVLALLYC